MKTYSVGSGAHVDICLNDGHVSPVHLLLSQDGRGRFHLFDRSDTGTFLWRDGQWLRTAHCEMALEDKLSLGGYVITVRQLFAQHPALNTFKNQPPEQGYYDLTQQKYAQERNPQTGEIR